MERLSVDLTFEKLRFNEIERKTLANAIVTLSNGIKLRLDSYQKLQEYMNNATKSQGISVSEAVDNIPGISTSTAEKILGLFTDLDYREND